MLDIIAKPVEALVSGVVGWFTSRQKLKEVELQSKIEVAKARAAAKIDLYKSGVVGDIAWEKDSLDNSGWKDEFWTVVISMPLILAWCPWTADWVTHGFETFATMPDWYQIAFGICVSSAFGFKKFAEIMSLKNGVNVSRVHEVKQLLADMPEDKN